MSKITKARHGDAVLSDEEFAKAIDEYKMRKAEREKTDADDVEEVEVVDIEPKPETLEDKVAEVKARRDRRDEEGDPKDVDEAMSTIAHQDEDLDILFDIIDTLLAKQDFDAAEPEEEEEFVDEEEEVKEDELDKLNKLKGDADDEEEFIDEEEEEEIAEDADDEEEEIVDEEEIAEDADEDVEDEEVIEEEDWEEDACDKEERMDSAASRAIRNHMLMGKLGRQVGLKNLEMKGIKDAKIAIIKAVRPDMRLDGKSDAYINGAFDNARKSIRAKKIKDTNYQKRQMFNNDSREAVKTDSCSAMDARQRMIERLNNK